MPIIMNADGIFEMYFTTWSSTPRYDHYHISRQKDDPSPTESSDKPILFFWVFHPFLSHRIYFTGIHTVYLVSIDNGTYNGDVDWIEFTADSTLDSDTVADTGSDTGVDTNPVFHIFLLLGQFNMAGFPTAQEDKVKDKRTKVLSLVTVHLRGVLKISEPQLLLLFMNAGMAQ
jgi:hypothetical protein